jgi:large conductance mechanosensitive channel
MLKGFKEFITRGNVVDLAVAVAIGTAFAAVVTQFTESFINPLIKLIGGGGLKGGSFTINDVVFDWASFINKVIYFVIVAAVIYFVVVVPINTLTERARRNKQIEEAPLPADIALLTEIRDLLRTRNAGTGSSPSDPGAL